MGTLWGHCGVKGTSWGHHGDIVGSRGRHGDIVGSRGRRGDITEIWGRYGDVGPGDPSRPHSAGPAASTPRDWPSLWPRGHRGHHRSPTPAASSWWRPTTASTPTPVGGTAGGPRGVPMSPWRPHCPIAPCLMSPWCPHIPMVSPCPHCPVSHVPVVSPMVSPCPSGVSMSPFPVSHVPMVSPYPHGVPMSPFLMSHVPMVSPWGPHIHPLGFPIAS